MLYTTCGRVYVVNPFTYTLQHIRLTPQELTSDECVLTAKNKANIVHLQTVST